MTRGFVFSRKLLLQVAMVVGCVAAASAVLGSILFAANDFGDRNDFLYELWPPYQSLIQFGSLHAFLVELPSYVGAAIWRLPFAWLAIHLGAGWRITFWATAVPCYAAPVLFGLWYARRPGLSADERTAALWTMIAVTVLDPVVWYTGLLGHPEEIVGIMLVLASVVMASEGRLVWALVLMVAGLLNKPGLGEAIPVMAVALPPRYARPALGIVAIGGVGYGLYNITPLATTIPIHDLVAHLGGDFLPSQLLWWLGRHAWLSVHAHILVVPACTAVCGLWLCLRGRHLGMGPVRRREVLWLLGLVFLLRTAFEPWDILYYNLPLVYCVACLEIGAIPWLTGLASVAIVVVVPANPILALGQTATAGVYAAVAVPSLLVFAVRVYGGPARIQRRQRRALEPTVLSER